MNEQKQQLTELELDAVVGGGTNSTTSSSSSTNSTGRCNHQDFVITKYVDLASPKLY
jgi:type VI protein secretion system component Hcp